MKLNLKEFNDTIEWSAGDSQVFGKFASILAEACGIPQNTEFDLNIEINSETDELILSCDGPNASVKLLWKNKA